MTVLLKLQNNKEIQRFLRFAVVGVIGAVVDFGIFNLLTKFDILPPDIAQIISFTCAVISNFLWNRFWTYPDSRSKSVSRQVIQFFVVNIVGLLIRTPLFSFLQKILVVYFTQWNPLPFLKPQTIGYNLSLASAVIVVMFWNFFINRFWTYNDVK